MDNKKYEELASSLVPKEKRLFNAIISFIIGGFIGMLGQIIVTILIMYFNIEYKDATSLMIVLLIFISSLLTALGIFDEWVSFAKCGLIIPITGFAHAITSSMMEYKNEGLVTGIGSNAFKLAGSVILFGVVSAYFFGIIRYLIGG